jgi:hypothetical protein
MDTKTAFQTHSTAPATPVPTFGTNSLATFDCVPAHSNGRADSMGYRNPGATSKP